MAYPAAMGALSDSWSGGRKLGGNYYGGSFGKNYRAQSLQYKRALRQLTYRARRGDTNSTLAAIKLRDEANERGYTPVNQERGEFMKDMRGAYKSRIEAGQAMDRENALDRGRVNEGLGALEEMRRRREEEDKRREEEDRKRRDTTLTTGSLDTRRDMSAVDRPQQIRTGYDSIARNTTRRLGDQSLMARV